MEYLLPLKIKNTGKYVNNLCKCSVQLVLQWMFCNIYPQTIAGVTNCITKMDESYKTLKKSSSKKSTSAKHWNDYEIFVELQMNLFVIKTTEEIILYQQKLWGVKMVLS